MMRCWGFPASLESASGCVSKQNRSQTVLFWQLTSSPRDCFLVVVMVTRRRRRSCTLTLPLIARFQYSPRSAAEYLQCPRIWQAFIYGYGCGFGYGCGYGYGWQEPKHGTLISTTIHSLNKPRLPRAPQTCSADAIWLETPFPKWVHLSRRRMRRVLAGDEQMLLCNHSPWNSRSITKTHGRLADTESGK